MRIRSSIFLIIFLVFFLSHSTDGRIFFIGSNPYYSWIAFPQDIRKFHGNFLYYYPSYQQFPWWGDIDEPHKRPNPTYTATEEKIGFPNSPYFSHEGKNRHVENRFGLFYKLNEQLFNLTDIQYSLGILKNSASGNFSNSSSTTTIPFEFEVSNLIHNLYITSILGFEIQEIPFGLKFGFGFNEVATPDSYIRFSKESIHYESQRLLWGWSTSPCNHIFGATGVEGDAWLQREYSRGPLFRFDLQGGATLPRVKLGARFRYITGLQDQYAWVQDSAKISQFNDLILWQNFSGTYEKSEWSKKSRNALARLYGNIFWKKSKAYSLNTLLFLQYEGKTAFDALSHNLEIEDDGKEKMRNFIIEINPNINIFPANKSAYIDIGLLLEYSYSRFENTFNRYISGGGQKEAFINSHVYQKDEYWYERFSYANENFFDAGLDISTMFPLFRRADKRLALGFILFANTKATWQKKYYGRNPNSGNEGSFSVENLRKNFKHEIWFNSMFNLQYAFSNYNLRFEITEPLLYSLSPKTQVTDATEKTILYEHAIKGTWSSLNGVKVALFVSYNL